MKNLIRIKEVEKANFETIFNEVIEKLNSIIADLEADGIEINNFQQLDQCVNMSMPSHIARFEIELASRARELKKKGITFGKDDFIIGTDKEPLNKYEASVLKGSLENLDPRLFATIRFSKEIGWKMKNFRPELCYIEDNQIKVNKDKYDQYIKDNFYEYSEDATQSEREILTLEFIEALNKLNKAFNGKYDYMDLQSIWIGFDPAKGYFFRKQLYNDDAIEALKIYR